MRSPLSVGRNLFSLKASHHRLSLRVSHRRDDATGSRVSCVSSEEERERYIAPPKRRR